MQIASDGTVAYGPRLGLNMAIEALDRKGAGVEFVAVGQGLLGLVSGLKIRWPQDIRAERPTDGQRKQQGGDRDVDPAFELLREHSGSSMQRPWQTRHPLCENRESPRSHKRISQAHTRWQTK